VKAKTYCQAVKTVKFTLAFLLIPVLWASWEFAIWLLLSVQPQNIPWLEFTSFGVGFSLASCLFWAGIRPNWLYVLGHESTHAVAVWMHRGKVSGFKARSDGGHVIADRDSTLISLSPYLLPFYPILVAGAWILLTLAFPAVRPFIFIFLIIWGLSWGFHGAFTAQLIFTDQPDFRNHGRFYSIFIILLINSWIIIAGLWLSLRGVPFSVGMAEWGHRSAQIYISIGRWLVDAVAKLL
jgi:hypothetical protein